MVQIMQKKSFGPQGNAKVTMGTKVVRVQLDGEVYELPLEAWDKKYPNGEYNVLLGKNLDKIISVKPPFPGTHIVKFVEFSNRNNEVPEPKIQRGGPRKTKMGGSYIAPDKLVYTSLLEICDGSQYDGLRIVDTHTYGFDPVPGSPDAMIVMEGQKDLERFEAFMRAQGINLGQLVIPYSGNVLPWLEAQLQSSAKPFMVTTNDKGFVDTRSPVPAHLLPKAKKQAKKTTKK
jgi:hypothetical protein